MDSGVTSGCRPSRRLVVVVGAVATWLFWLFCPAVASAHTVGVSQSDFTIEPDGTVRALIVFSRVDAARLGQMDRDHDGVISPSEVEESASVFRQVVDAGVVVRADGTSCTGNLEGGGDTGGDGFGLSVLFTCREPPRVLEVDLPLLSQLPPGHGHVLRIVAGASSTQKLLTGDDRSACLTLPSKTSEASAAGRARAFGSAFAGALGLGVMHILRGWDHLLFLAALLLGARGLRGLVAAVSAFTVAHSITLAVAALGVYAPSPRWVEPAIAASIAFVAFENALRQRPEHRWRITFVFGLVHGFGFAGALQQVAMSRDRLVPTLLGFNVGVEVGQLGFIVVALPLFALLRRSEAFETQWMRRFSMAVGLIGVCLCIVRIVKP